jgi:hypothetical protein
MYMRNQTLGKCKLEKYSYRTHRIRTSHDKVRYLKSACFGFLYHSEAFQVRVQQVAFMSNNICERALHSVGDLNPDISVCKYFCL